MPPPTNPPGPGSPSACPVPLQPPAMGILSASQHPGAGRGRADLGRGRAGPGDRHHPVPVGPQHPGRRGPGVLLRRAVPGPPARPRGARGPVPIGPGTLLVIDEASMLSGPDLADLIAYAQARGAKIILAGDTSQLQAVENGGGMSLLAQTLGYARLAEPVRFRALWEQHASLRLRDGDTSVLAEYDQRGRIIGGDPEQIMDAAAAADLRPDCGRHRQRPPMAADDTLRRELNRRIRDDLTTLGTVPARPRGHHRRRHPGQPRGPDHRHPQRPRHRGGRARPNPGQRRSSPHRGHHSRRPDRAPGPGRRPGHRAPPLSRPTLPVQKLRKFRAWYAVTDHAAQGRTVHRRQP